ncbi:phage tail protein [Vogesella sp. XCS3]|uniref:phage tail-collar fiber domain-containing protein n=1 Tax=Vogesella sp. XCS3 TaxID=2877939 RepID=UPI001D0AB2FE|nr:phage tail protein [Vogesella sp. XCS3]UDM18406.1 phage tail protein [Vogesella sp. XCS3]
MSSTPLLPIITEAGLNAIWRASNDGVSAQITHIALGDAAYTPNQGMTRLQSERARYPVADGKRLTSRQIHLTALADGNAEFWVREVAFILSDGTTLAIWSDPNKPLAYKAAGVDLLLAYDLTLSAVPADSVTVQSTGAGLSLAMAEEYTALAIAQISEMQRGLKRDDKASEQADHLATIDQRLAEHDKAHAETDVALRQLRTLEQEHHTAQTALATAQAAALINLQRIVLQPVLNKQ